MPLAIAPELDGFALGKGSRVAAQKTEFGLAQLRKQKSWQIKPMEAEMADREQLLPWSSSPGWEGAPCWEEL